MTTDTAVLESELDMPGDPELGNTPPWPCAEETLAAHEDWRYLFVDGMDVRPANKDEQAEYAARRKAQEGIYAPYSLPHIVLPPTDEVAELTEIAAGAADSAPAPDEDDWLYRADEAQHAADETLARWTHGKSTRLADPEVAQPDPHAQTVEGTVVLEPLPPEVA